jgi:hypothetical protein
MLQVGSEIQCEEYLHGKIHVLRLHLTSIEAGNHIEYEIVGLGKGNFQVISRGEEVEFLAALAFGSDIPLIGALIDVVLRALLSRRLEAVRQHMREEGQILKKIIESGWEPRGIPLKS